MQFSAYTTKTAEELFEEFRTARTGLSVEAAGQLLEQHGRNELKASTVDWWEILVRQLKTPFVYLLILAGVLTFFLSEKIDSLMIFLFVAVNTGLGFYQEFKSEKSLQLLKSFAVSKARVVRNGKDERIESTLLVPGDIIIVEAGDIVPADARIIEETDLSVDESVLTGESAPVKKEEASSPEEIHQLYEAENIIFSGTHIVSGRGLGVIIATGRASVIGDIARLTSETEHVSAFELGIKKFSKFILRMIMLTLAFVFAANILIKGGDANVTQLIVFSIALAVSVIPEALPVVTTLSLSRGAVRLAKKQVVVKRLSAIEGLGSIDILCTDKTGTLTENRLEIASVYSKDDAKTLRYAAIASQFLGETKQLPNNAFDIGVWDSLNESERNEYLHVKRLSEIPFDPVRRQNSVLVQNAGASLLIVRGAPEGILERSANLSPSDKLAIVNWIKSQGTKGCRVIAIATRDMGAALRYDENDEQSLQFQGCLSFTDPVKPSTVASIQQAKKLGVQIKMLTGDSLEVATAVAKDIGLISEGDKVLLGETFEQLSHKEQEHAVETVHVFARMSPEQKFSIIQLLQHKFDVGFLGEGINDAPALKVSNVGLVVQHAADISREAADVILLQKSLEVIINGIKEGREVFANTIKYIKATLASNFGNFYAIAIATLIIDFLPMLPIQLLLVNLLSDFPMMAIAADSVDKEELRRPRTYQVKEIVMVATLLGLVSTVFDFIFFGLFYRISPEVLQTNWFIGSILTELVLIYSIRTRGSFLKAVRPSFVVNFLTCVAIVLTIGIPFTSIGQSFFSFKQPTLSAMVLIIVIVGCYFVITEFVKRQYYKTFGAESHVKGMHRGRIIH